MQTYEVYCLKNKDGVVTYVGVTTAGLSFRKYGHNKEHPNRRKYTIHKLAETNDKEDAKQLENWYINMYNTVATGENITYGFGRKGIGPNQTSFSKNNSYGCLGTKSVRCVETGRIYPSITTCSKDTGLSITKISACCRGKRKTTGSCHFEFVPVEDL